MLIWFVLMLIEPFVLACISPLPAHPTDAPVTPVLTAVSPASVTVSAVPLSGWSIFRHEQLGIAFHYPPGWQAYDYTAAFVRFTDTKQGEEAFNVVNGGFTVDTVSDFLEHIAPTVVMTRTLTLDGQPALFMQLQLNGAVGEYQSVAGIITPDKRTITIGNRTTNPMIFEQILTTVRFFTPINPP